MYAYIARQPIFNTAEKVVGYELLYRDGTAGNAANIMDGDAATRGVLADAITVFGIPKLTNKLPAYINFTRNLLLNDFAYLANPKEVVLELMEDMEVDGLLIDKLRELRKAGYTLALQGYGYSTRFDKITQFFDVIRVDFRKYNTLQVQEILKRMGKTSFRLKMLAEKVETYEIFAAAKKMGFELFQGYFFEKPTKLSKQVPPLAASSYGRLLNELMQPTVDFDVCCQIIKSDVVLTYMLMRQVQTVNYYRGNIVTEIKHGLVMMGTDELRRWVCLVMVRQTNLTHSDEMPKKAYLRGRFIEKLMENSNEGLDPRQGFLMGMFSLLDQILGVPMDQLLKDLQLDDEMKATLQGEAETRYSKYLQYVILFELGNSRLVLPNLYLRLGESQVSALYMACIADTDKAFSRMGGTNV